VFPQLDQRQQTNKKRTKRLVLVLTPVQMLAAEGLCYLHLLRLLLPQLPLRTAQLT